MNGVDARFAGDGQPLDERVCAATVRCVARTGARRLTLDDIAEEAGCSRASIYRAFPGGKEVLFRATVEHQVALALDEVAAAVGATDTLADALTAAVATAARLLHDHPALARLFEHEPEVVLPHLAFDGLEPALARAVEFLGPMLERHLEPETAAEAAEWAARLVVLYSSGLPANPYDLTDAADAARLVHTHLIPGLTATRTQEQTDVVN